MISSGSHQKGDPHLTDANSTLLLSMVEATDDSFIFSGSLDSVVQNTLAMERFQFVYE